MFLIYANIKRRLLGSTICMSIAAFSFLLSAPASYAQNQDGNSQGGGGTSSPIKHVIIIVGENRSFDHLFATYVPKNGNESVKNLLSEGVINADGTPGPNFAKAHQYQIVSAPNGGSR